MSPSATSAAVLNDLQQRQELSGYCHRMLGSAFDADDAVQETMVRVWTRLDSFEGRSSVRSWLYRIATNVCLDMLRARRRRALPMDVDGGGEVVLDGDLFGVGDGDPADAAIARDMVRSAFVVALQQLPARQRSVLILRDVLRWQASEVAELLGTSVAAVNSSLQRARAALAAAGTDPAEASGLLTAGEQATLRRYVDAFEGYDVGSLVAILREDATVPARR